MVLGQKELAGTHDTMVIPQLILFSKSILDQNNWWISPCTYTDAVEAALGRQFMQQESA